ncbi:MAG: TetR/AcrR family transcriptional regulator [Bacillota bacterium]
MPKIIKDIENKIFSAAFSLFSQSGFRKTSMKKIAEEADIAVGTLYNYYSTKREIFLEIIFKSWEKTFTRLDQIVEDNEKDFYDFLKLLYEEIESRRGLGNEILKNNILPEDGFQILANVKDNVLLRLEKKFNQEFEMSVLSAKEKEKLINLIFISTVDLLNQYPEEKEENLNFIHKILINLDH